MRQKLKLLVKVHSIIYRYPVLKEAFRKNLPFKVSDASDTFLAAQIKAAEFESKLLSLDYMHLMIYLRELKEYDMYSCIGIKDNHSKRIKNILDEFTQKSASLHLVINVLKNISEKSCLVGGAIRDIVSLPEFDKTLRLRDIKDFDFVTDACYEAIGQNLQKAGFKIDETGKNFLVLRATLDYDTYEIACYRKDNTYKDGRRPESVEIGDIFTDSARRDFTINSLYYDLNKEVLLDPTGMGIADADMDVLRFNGNPDKRINEDYLRVFRAYRFISKGYTAEPRTLNAIRSNFALALKCTDQNRIREEIERMAKV